MQATKNCVEGLELVCWGNTTHAKSKCALKASSRNRAIGSDFYARVWKSDQGGRNSMQEMHRNQTKCMEFQPIKKSSNFWTSIFCPGINFSCSKSLWIWWTIDPLILACLKLMTYASFSTKQLLAVLMDGNPCTNGWNSMHQNRKNVIASCFFEQSCLRQVKIQDPWQT